MATEPPPSDLHTFPSDADVDAALAEFGGDHRATIRALLHDLSVLAEDREENVSSGFVRGRHFRLIVRS